MSHLGAEPAPDGGVNILTPLALREPAAPLLLVDRGVVPAAELEAFLRQEAERAPGETEITGRLVRLSLQPVAPGSVSEPRQRWLRFDPARPDAVAALQAQLPGPLAPLLLEAGEGPPGMLPRGGIHRPTSPVSHVSYALFWFALALATIGHWIGFGIQRARDARRAAASATLARRASVEHGRSGGEIS